MKHETHCGMTMADVLRYGKIHNEPWSGDEGLEDSYGCVM